jgi:hypothetical protein
MVSMPEKHVPKKVNGAMVWMVVIFFVVIFFIAGFIAGGYWFG